MRWYEVRVIGECVRIMCEGVVSYVWWGSVGEEPQVP